MLEEITKESLIKMKRILFMFIMLFIFFSCKENKNVYSLKNGFLRETGVYVTKDKKIYLKEFVDGTLMYSVTDKKGNTLLQSNLSESFNKDMFWYIYFDEKENLWVYISDYEVNEVWCFDRETFSYRKSDFNSYIKLPDEFKTAIKNR